MNHRSLVSRVEKYTFRFSKPGSPFPLRRPHQAFSFFFFKPLSTANRGRGGSGSRAERLPLSNFIRISFSFLFRSSSSTTRLLTQLLPILIERKINEPLHSWFRGKDFIGVLSRGYFFIWTVAAFTGLLYRGCFEKILVTNWYCYLSIYFKRRFEWKMFNRYVSIHFLFLL